MTNKASLALELARKQKRLLHWKAIFSESDLNSSLRSEFQNILNTYTLLISKMSYASDKELSNIEAQLWRLEREISRLFELRRLATSEVGTAVAIQTSER